MVWCKKYVPKSASSELIRSSNNKTNITSSCHNQFIRPCGSSHIPGSTMPAKKRKSKKVDTTGSGNRPPTPFQQQVRRRPCWRSDLLLVIIGVATCLLSVYITCLSESLPHSHPHDKNADNILPSKNEETTLINFNETYHDTGTRSKKLSIILIGNDFVQQFPLTGYGGIEAWVETIAKELSRQGIKFSVITPKVTSGKKECNFPVIETPHQAGVGLATFINNAKRILSMQKDKPDVIWSCSN